MARIKLSLNHNDYQNIHALEQAGMLSGHRRYQLARDSNIGYIRLFTIEYPEWRKNNVEKK